MIPSRYAGFWIESGGGWRGKSAVMETAAAEPVVEAAWRIVAEVMPSEDGETGRADFVWQVTLVDESGNAEDCRIASGYRPTPVSACAHAEAVIAVLARGMAVLAHA